MVDKAIEIALAIVASVGGFGVVFSAVVYFTSNFIAERLQKKYELKLNERFEKYKAGIENKTYISKTKFDAEHYSTARASVVVAQDELNSNAPFIPEQFYESYEEIRRLGGLQLSEFEERWNVGYFAPQEEKETLSREAYKRTGEINEKFKKLNNEIREYLKTLDVLD